MAPSPGLASNTAYMNISRNALVGGIPQVAGGGFVAVPGTGRAAAEVVLDPMRKGGLCGDIPVGMNASSATRGRLQGVLPAGPCPAGGHSYPLLT